MISLLLSEVLLSLWSDLSLLSLLHENLVWFHEAKPQKYAAAAAAAAAKLLQSCPTLRDPMDCSLPGSSVHGIFQARVLEWVAIAFSDRSMGAH